MDLITRNKLPSKLALFGMTYGDSGVESALRAVGIKPTRYQGIAGGKGRISLYDPMVAWVLAATWESSKRRFTGLDRELGSFRKLYDRLAESADAERVPGFVDDRELGAQLLMLCSPRFGFEPRDIRTIAKKRPKVFELSRFGRRYLVTVLEAYNTVYGRTIMNLSIDPARNPPRTLAQQESDFAAEWLHEAGERFGWDEYNASDEGAHFFGKSE